MKTARCKDCQWVHEADSIKNTSFRGVEFCGTHNRAVNSYEELLAAAKEAKTAIREAMQLPGHEYMADAFYHLDNAIAETGGQV